MFADHTFVVATGEMGIAMVVMMVQRSKRTEINATWTSLEGLAI